jgi:hypothetical protein
VHNLMILRVGVCVESMQVSKWEVGLAHFTCEVVQS